MDDALAAYEVRRNAATLPDYHENLEMAQLEPASSDMLALQAALRGHADDTTLYAMAAFGTIPPEAFFNPDNLERIMAPTTQLRTGSSPAALARNAIVA